MKKLMIAAAAAAMVGGVYAECVGCGVGKVIIENPGTEIYVGETVAECVAGHVWDLSIKAKTLGNKCTKCTKCDTCDTTDTAMYYDNVSRTFTGVAWTCYCPCTDDLKNIGTDDFDDDDIQDKTDMLFWDEKNKVGFGYIDFTYTDVTTEIPDAKPGYTYYSAEWVLDADVSELDFVEVADAFRYGKKADKAAWGFDYAGTGNNRKETARPQNLQVKAIGLGTVKTFKTKGAPDYIVINKISGSCVGSVTACPCEEDDDLTGQIIPVCYDFSNWCDDGMLMVDAPFYGTFTAKYNKTKSAKLRSTPGYLQQLFPAYCVKINGEVQ